MIIKVCGMRDPENIRAVEELLADSAIVHGTSYMNMMGFIFWPKSKRFVNQRPAYLPERCKRVGVFVDASISDILKTAADYTLDYIQLHGSESPDDITQLRHHLSATTKVIKAFNIATAADLEATQSYEGLADHFLFDTKSSLPGGSGSQFDWTVLSSYSGTTPFLLSGGIGPNDVEALNSTLSTLNPHCAGIDLNSRFETEPGLKDVAALRRFFNELNHQS